MGVLPAALWSPSPPVPWHPCRPGLPARQDPGTPADPAAAPVLPLLFWALPPVWTCCLPELRKPQRPWAGVRLSVPVTSSQAAWDFGSTPPQPRTPRASGEASRMQVAGRLEKTTEEKIFPKYLMWMSVGLCTGFRQLITELLFQRAFQSHPRTPGAAPCRPRQAPSRFLLLRANMSVKDVSPSQNAPPALK